MTNLAYRKVKSVAKDVVPKGNYLQKLVLSTMKTVSDVVGATLGPGGCPVIIERQETGFPNLITKDGVTVFRSLGFDDPVQHAIMETARDASVRTATEAGDGTTTASILSEAIVRYMSEYLSKHPKSSPQKVVRYIERFFQEEIEPEINHLKMPVTEDVKRAVAMCSSNGDKVLTDSILRCFDITGDEGNVTILEESGPSGYKVEQLRGYPAGIGYEDSCRRFFPPFINDKPNNRCYLENPIFILYYGVLNEIQTLLPLMSKIGHAWERDPKFPHNVVICAMGFSEGVLGTLAGNFASNETLNVYPLLIPKNGVHNCELHFLQDIQAVSNSMIFDPLSAPLESARLEDLGPPLEYFEATRYRSNIVGTVDPDLVMARIEELKVQLQNPESIYEKTMLEERIGKLTGGIAKLTVVGASSGEIREKRDRAEDAVCAIRGAIKHGALPGAGWTLSRLMSLATYMSGTDGVSAEESDILMDVVFQALFEPINRLMTNAGLNKEEIQDRYAQMVKWNASTGENAMVWNGVTDKFEPCVQSGIVDSVPAVLEAIRNSISIATLLGTLGGAVVFQRDVAVEREEASEAYQWLANSAQKDQQQ